MHFNAHCLDEIGMKYKNSRRVTTFNNPREGAETGPGTMAASMRRFMPGQGKGFS